MTLPLIAAERWYETIPFGEGVTLLCEPWMPPSIRCNMWIIEGRERILLIDAGLGAVPMRRHVPVLNGGKPVTLLLSHTHFDHIGMAAEFDDRLAHPIEAAILSNPTNDATLAQSYLAAGQEAELFWGLPPGWDGAAYGIAPAPATGFVADGDRIDLGGRLLTVLHTPGHSPGHVALFEEGSGTLFPQDAVYDGRLLDALPGSDVAEYVCTMRRLRDLEPKVVHPGHFGSFGLTRYRQIIDGYLAAH
ncbi:MBL fold metallo-hydrolase [Mangrovicella endophytica]|uniref:MBL fold metallo-hydrolase n=1 Tax=Mangrovicella endophytica TaxID=2066697 RepID=UPI00315B2E03